MFLFASQGKMKILLSHQSFFRLTVLISILVICSYTSPLSAGSISLSWYAPSTNEDGTPLTDLAGYRIYYGTVSGNYTHMIDAGNVRTYTVPNLTDGRTYYFVATAYNSALFESSYSNEVSKAALSISSEDTHNSMGQNSLNVTKSGTGNRCSYLLTCRHKLRI